MRPAWPPSATELSRIRPGLAVEDGDDLVVASDPALAGQRLPARIARPTTTTASPWPWRWPA